MGVDIFATITTTPAALLLAMLVSVAIGWWLAWIYASGR